MDTPITSARTAPIPWAVFEDEDFNPDFFVCLFCGHSFDLDCNATPYCSDVCAIHADMEGHS